MDTYKNRKKEIQDELKDISPFLHQLKEKESPFKVPENYFNNFQNQVLKQLEQEEELNAQRRASWNLNSYLQSLLDQLSSLLQPKLALGFASLLLLAVAIWTIYPSNKVTTPNEDLSFANLSIDEIQDYIDANFDAFDEETFEEVAQEDNSIPFMPSNFSDKEEIDQYLDDVIDQIDPEELEELF